MLRRALNFITKICSNRGFLLYVPPLFKQTNNLTSIASSNTHQDNTEHLKDLLPFACSSSNILKIFTSITSKTSQMSIPLRKENNKKQLNILDSEYIRQYLNQNVNTTNSKFISEKESNVILSPIIRNSKKNLNINNQDKIQKNITQPEAQIARERVSALLKNREEHLFIPEALFISNTTQNEILIKEAIKLQLPLIGIIDSNSNPLGIDYPIPGNDDNLQAQDLYMKLIIHAIREGKKKEIISTFNKSHNLVLN